MAALPGVTSARTVRVVPSEGLDLGGELLRVISGAVHYWRLEPELWEEILRTVRSLGFGVVETYIPWSIHETATGEFDFTGVLDVVRFIEVAGEQGLRVIVRPGPHVNSELPDFGIPPRVLWDPECQAHTPFGTPTVSFSASHFFPTPSYVSGRFQAEIRGWYEAIIPRLAPLQWPDGPVVACQVDNEMGYFFQVPPFSCDFRPEMAQLWRERSGFEGDPPTSGEDDPARVEAWMRLREDHIRDVLRLMADWQRELGMNRVPLFHNDFPHLFTPIDQATLEASGAVDIAGDDAYGTREGMAFVRQVARTLVGSSVLPFLPEFGAGWTSDLFQYPIRRDMTDEEASLLSVLFCGARAWNFYMLVERERWYGSPISRKGEVRPGAELYRRMHRLITEDDWFSFRRVAPVLLLRNKDAERSLTSRVRCTEMQGMAFGRVFPPALSMLDDPLGSQPLVDFPAAWRTHLESVGLDFDEGSSDAPPDLDGYELVIVPAAPDGSVPQLDHPYVVTASASPAVELPPSRLSMAGVTSGISLHHFRHTDGRELFAALNSGGDVASFTLGAKGVTELRGLWRDQVLAGDGEFTVTLPAYGGQIWSVQP